MRAASDAKSQPRDATPAAVEAPRTVLAAWTATVVRALDAQGQDGAAVARSVGIDPALFGIDGARVPLAATSALWEAATRVTGDPCFPLDVARFVRPSTFHGLSVGVVSSTSFREALQRMVRYSALVCSPAGVVEVREGGGRTEYSNSWPDGEVSPCHESMEAISACIVRAARFLHGRGLSPIEVRLRRPCAPVPDRYPSFFGCPVQYGSADDTLVFATADVDRPNPAGCDVVARGADHVVRDYLDALPRSARITEQVRARVVVRLGSAEPTPSAVAADLAMSPRTLQRRLHEEGTTFRVVVEDVRMDTARQLLTERREGTDAVARRLGFSDSTAFRRAFKRRTGMTPAAFRAAGQRGGVELATGEADLSATPLTGGDASAVPGPERT